MPSTPGTVDPAAEQRVVALQSPAAFEHAVSQVDVVETHISWLLLTEDYVYKLKKPLVLDFLDFGDLDKRRHFCEEEIRLNKPFAPDIYLDVVPVTLDGGQPRFGGSGEVVDYAVRMRRFDESRRLDRELAAGRLTPSDMTELAQVVAARHQSAEHISADQRERVLRLTRAFMNDNLDALAGRIDDASLRPLRSWTTAELDRHAEYLGKRFDDGFVRDCHGDLHLGNLVRLDSGIATFDCIEFDPDLRHIDVMADIGFLVMDLLEKERADLAAGFLNRYLEITGDYAGVAVLRLFVVYRCLVRAKVAMIRAAERKDPDTRRADEAEAVGYCELAARETAARNAGLVLMHGFSGSGKTRVSGELMTALPAVRLRSDIERKRIFGLAETADSGAPVGGGIYAGPADDRVYAELCALATKLLANGYNVILDAAFLSAARRDQARAAADAAGCRAVIVDVTAPVAVLRERLRRRADLADDASEADVRILEHQRATADELTDAEQKITVTCDNTESPDVAEVTREVRHGITQR